jgi:hypothetical protein
MTTDMLPQTQKSQLTAPGKLAKPTEWRVSVAVNFQTAANHIEVIDFH